MLTSNTWKRFSFPEKPPEVFTPELAHTEQITVQVPESQENPRSKANMTILCTSHGAGHKTQTPTAGDHCSGAHVRPSGVGGGCSALKAPTPTATPSDLEEPINSISPSTVLILPPVVRASHPTEMAGPTRESFISIQVGRQRWGFLHPRNQVKRGRTVSFAPCIQTPSPDLNPRTAQPREPHPGLPLPPTHPSLSPPSSPPPPPQKGHPSLPGNGNARSAAGMADRCVTAATTLSRCRAKASSYYNRSGWGCDRPRTQGCVRAGCTGFGTTQNTEPMCRSLSPSPTPQLTGL